MTFSGIQRQSVEVSWQSVTVMGIHPLFCNQCIYAFDLSTIKNTQLQKHLSHISVNLSDANADERTVFWGHSIIAPFLKHCVHMMWTLSMPFFAFRIFVVSVRGSNAIVESVRFLSGGLFEQNSVDFMSELKLMLAPITIFYNEAFFFVGRILECFWSTGRLRVIIDQGISDIHVAGLLWSSPEFPMQNRNDKMSTFLLRGRASFYRKPFFNVYPIPPRYRLQNCIIRIYLSECVIHSTKLRIFTH